TLTTLYNFCSQSGCADGSNPDWGAALVQGTDGNFYGTTEDRGGQQTYENGTIFKITPSGTLTTLYTFAEGQGSPQSSLIQATDGNLYGTVVVGGANGQGAVFSITPSGTLTTLYSFCSQSGCTDGSRPQAALVQATNGTFYGTTGTGGITSCNSGYGCGTIFSLSVLIGPPTNKDQCKDGGWQTFNFPRKFKNQGDCVSFVNNGR